MLILNEIKLNMLRILLKLIIIITYFDTMYIVHNIVFSQIKAVNLEVILVFI